MSCHFNITSISALQWQLTAENTLFRWWVWSDYNAKKLDAIWRLHSTGTMFTETSYSPNFQACTKSGYFNLSAINCNLLSTIHQPISLIRLSSLSTIWLSLAVRQQAIFIAVDYRKIALQIQIQKHQQRGNSDDRISVKQLFATSILKHVCFLKYKFWWTQRK
jgi:hypothetical protein